MESSLVRRRERRTVGIFLTSSSSNFEGSCQNTRMSSSGVNHNWTAADDALLGKMPDGQVAQRIGVTPLSVFNRRKRLRIPAINRDAPPPAFLRSEAGSPSAPEIGRAHV